MEYVVSANERNADQLLKTAKSWFFEFCSSPFWVLVFVKEGRFNLRRRDGGSTIFKVNLDPADESVYIHDDDGPSPSISVTLPQIHHWEAEFEKVVPGWVDQAFGGLYEVADIFDVLRFWDGQINVGELAVFLKRPVFEIAQGIQSTYANQLDAGQQILALSVDMAEPDPKDWLVDIRGYLLGTLYGQLIPG